MYGVGEVSWPASRNVPTAIAVAKSMKRVAVKRVENRILESFFSIAVAFKFIAVQIYILLFILP